MKPFIFFLLIFCSYQAMAQVNTDSLKKVEQEVKQMPNDTNKVNAYNQLVNAYLFQDTKRAFENAQNALKVAQEINNTKAIALSYKNMGNAMYLQGNLQEAKKYYEKGLEKSIVAKDKVQEGNCLNNLGNVYTDMGDFDKALEYLFKSLKIQEEFGNEKTISNAHLNIGNIMKYQNNLNDAIAYYEKSLEMAEKIDFKINIANANNNIGTIYSTQKKYKQAVERLEKSLDAHRNINNKRGESIALLNLGDVYQATDSLNKAYRYYEESLEIAKNNKDLLMEGLLLANKGVVKTKQKDFEQALTFLQQGLALLQKSGAKDEISNVYGAFSEYYETKGDYKNALAYHKSYKAAKDSIFNTQKNEQITKMQTIYETDKKEKENALLREKQKFQEEQNARKNIALLGGSVGLLLVIAIAIILFRNNQQKQRTNQILEEQAEELRSANDQITIQNQELKQQKEEITSQRDAIEKQGIELEKRNSELLHKNEQISSSINAAQLIQQAILPYPERFKTAFKDYFVFYQPKDIVSGDFYWLDQINDTQTLVAAIDCTGHGVPGAMMSMIAYSILDRIVHVYKITDPAEILNKMHQEVRKALMQEQTGNRDGMDIALCLLEKMPDSHTKILYAGAKRPLYYSNNQEVAHIKGIRKSIGGLQDENTTFENTEIILPQNSCLYLSSDGLIDQNDMERHKFGEKRFLDILLQNLDAPLVQQKEAIQTAINKHARSVEQRDDMVVIGIRV